MKYSARSYSIEQVQHKHTGQPFISIEQDNKRIILTRDQITHFVRELDRFARMGYVDSILEEVSR